MTLLMDQPAAAGSTLYPRGAGTDPDRQSAEDFYQRGATPSQRAVTIRAVGPDGSMRRDWLATYMESQINELLTLGPGWDGYHANPITLDAVGSVVAVAAHFSTELAVPPMVFPLADGGIQIEWHAGRESVEIEVDAEGDTHLLVTDETGAITVNAELPSDDRAGFAAARQAVERLSARLLRAG